jgi:hypothetical protein
VKKYRHNFTGDRIKSLIHVLELWATSERVTCHLDLPEALFRMKLLSRILHELPELSTDFTSAAWFCSRTGESKMGD